MENSRGQNRNQQQQQNSGMGQQRNSGLDQQRERLSSGSEEMDQTVSNDRTGNSGTETGRLNEQPGLSNSRSGQGSGLGTKRSVSGSDYDGQISEE